MDPVEPLAQDLWVTTRPLPLAVGDIGARMTVIRSGGDLVLHSPVALDDETKQAIDELGAVRFVVAPNKAHHLFVAPWATASAPSFRAISIWRFAITGRASEVPRR